MVNKIHLKKSINLERFKFNHAIRFSSINFNFNNLNLYLLDNKLIDLEEYNFLQQKNRNRIENNWMFSIQHKNDKIMTDLTVTKNVVNDIYIILHITNYKSKKWIENNLHIEIPTYLFFNYFLN